MTTFAERLKQLRIDKCLNQTQLAKDLSVDQRSISNWENAVREPSFDMLKKIANYFEVSTDYLLGITD